jgi:hypothetical protein
VTPHDGVALRSQAAIAATAPLPTTCEDAEIRSAVRGVVAGEGFGARVHLTDARCIAAAVPGQALEAIAVAAPPGSSPPMCQYSAEDGAANDWQLQHLGSLSLSGAGLVIVE